MNIVKILIPVAILGAGIIGMVGMFGLSSSETREDIVVQSVSVDVLTVKPQEFMAMVEGSGAVRSSQILPITPQVSGEVVFVSENFVPGGRFLQGETLFRIDSREYKLSLSQENSRVEQAELEFRLAEQRHEAAMREWQLLNNTGDVPDLASKRPQLEVARLALESAKAGQERATINLSRTNIRATFSSIVQDESVTLGQVVGPGSSLATLLGIDEFWVKVSVPVSRLVDIAIPENGVGGSTVTIKYHPTDQLELVRAGSVIRLESSLDPQARTATLLVSIPNPFQEGDFPLLSGAFVDVEIQGKIRSNIVRIPASALLNGDSVLLATPENTLDERKVVVGWKHAEYAYLSSGLNDGDRLITSPISFPLLGAPLSIMNSEDQNVR